MNLSRLFFSSPLDFGTADGTQVCPGALSFGGYMPHGFSKVGSTEWMFSLKTRDLGTNFPQISVFGAEILSKSAK